MKVCRAHENFLYGRGSSSDGRAIDYFPPLATKVPVNYECVSQVRALPVPQKKLWHRKFLYI